MPPGAHRAAKAPGQGTARTITELNSDADRRTITVLFADLSGFTGLTEQLDPEVVQALQNELFEELTASVENFGGFVDKFVGDALLALFGAPVAHEDDPERALRAALEMIKRTERLSERSKARVSSPLTLHIGINTGPVVAGRFGAGAAKSYSVTGDTVNTAQRLQSIAAPGEVLVGPLTYRLTRHAFSYDPLGDVSLRGRLGTVSVHRLKTPLESPRTARGLEALGLNAPLIGRNVELTRLVSSLDLACDGAAQLVRLVGEAGIGKSRLVDELLAVVGDEERFKGVAIRRANCSPLHAQSYGTLAAVLRSAYGLGERASAIETRDSLDRALEGLGLAPEEIAQLIPLFFYVLGVGDETLQHVEPEQLRRQILFAIRTVFERRLAQSPLLIIVEDLHWADIVSLEALRFLMDRLERRRLMLLFTHRPMLETDVLDSSRVSHTTLRLAPLSAESGQEMLSAFFGPGGGKDFEALRHRIFERAGGNPLFLEEIVRALLEVGVLKRDDSHWRIAADEPTADIPVSIQALLLARLDRLPRDVRRLAQEAAVIGPRFDAVLLGAIAPEPAKVESGLDLLCDAEILEEVATDSGSPASYRFTQTLLQDVIYQNLLLQRRTDMHARIAAALERLCGKTPQRLEDLILLGRHFSLSGEGLKGATYLMTAGDRARAMYANEDAIRLYEQALAGVSSEDPNSIALLERIADLCGPAGKRTIAQKHYHTLLEGYRNRGDKPAAARILRKLGRLMWDTGKGSNADALYAEAATLLDREDAPIERAHLLQERGRLAFRRGDHSAAARWADEALDQAQSASAGLDGHASLEAARATAEALNTKGVALARLGRGHEAVREVERSISVAEAADLPGAACRGYTNLSVLYAIVDPAKAIEVCRKGLEIARRIGDLGFQARLLSNLAVACCTFTDRCADEGVPAAEEAIALDRALDQREHLAVPLIVLGQIHQCHGQPELAARYYNDALEIAQDTGEPQLLYPCYDGLATLSLDLDKTAEAERFFELGREVCARHQLDPEGLIVLPFLD
jgi:adenylate cyclase